MRRRPGRGRFLRREWRLARGLNRRAAGPVERRVVRRSARRLWLGTAAAILLSGESAVKLHRQDMGRIEQATGKDASQLSAAELSAAMQKLGIEPLELTQDDVILIRKTEDPHSLPTHCAGCGAPLSPENLRWHDPDTAECLYCGTLVRVD